MNTNHKMGKAEFIVAAIALIAALFFYIYATAPANAAQTEPTDTWLVVKTIDIAQKLSICTTDCKVEFDPNGFTVAKSADFEDWQDCYIGVEGDRFILELAGCEGGR